MYALNQDKHQVVSDRLYSLKSFESVSSLNSLSTGCQDVTGNRENFTSPPSLLVDVNNAKVMPVGLWRRSSSRFVSERKTFGEYKNRPNIPHPVLGLRRPELRQWLSICYWLQDRTNTGDLRGSSRTKSDLAGHKCQRNKLPAFPPSSDRYMLDLKPSHYMSSRLPSVYRTA